jgi:restriction system protein
MAKDATFWGIHAGKTGDAESLFEKHNVVALGWHEMADLSHLNTREEFKAAVAKTYPNKKPGAIPNNAGQLYRFVHELKSGDIVVFPLKRTREIWLGEVKGEYEYDPALEPRYPHIRKVEWVQPCTP